MSDYTTESEVSVRARQRRRRSLIVTLGIVLLGLFFAFWYALSYYQSDNSASGSAKSAADLHPVRPQGGDSREHHGQRLQRLHPRRPRGLGVQEPAPRAATSSARSPTTPPAARPRTSRRSATAPRATARAKLLLTALPKDSKLHKDKRKGATVDLVARGEVHDARAGADHERRADVPGPDRRRPRPRDPTHIVDAVTAVVGLGEDAEARKARSGGARRRPHRVGGPHRRRRRVQRPLAHQRGAAPRLPRDAHLHQTRVGIRRLRSSFSLFRPVLREVPHSRHVAHRLRTLALPLGPARDLDVLLAGALVGGPRRAAGRRAAGRPGDRLR